VGEIVQALTGWLAAHTYAVVFVSSLVDGTGFPFPGRIVLVAAGAFAAAAGDVSLALVIGLGTAGVAASDHLWYFAGALGGDRLLGTYCRLTPRTPDCERRATDWLRRFGPFVIVAGRAVAVIRMLAWPLARDHGIRYPTFLLLDVPAALAWTAIWVGAGWLLGHRWADASDELRWIAAALALAAALAFTLLTLWHRRRPATP
jgi:membrane protein DedA with SNARE-associated domain